MATRSARHTILSETATFDAKTGELRVVVETPKGSRNKYDYDPDCDCLDLATVLPEGMAVGAIEAKQKAKGETWQRNDRLIAVATHAQTHENVKSLADLGQAGFAIPPRSCA
jgi:inorganic pyrophosphatase